MLATDMNYIASQILGCQISTWKPRGLGAAWAKLLEASISRPTLARTAPHPERNDPTSVLRMRHQRSLLLAGTFAEFVAPFSRLTPRVRRLVFTSWLPIGTPKIAPHPTPPCRSGISAGPLRLGT
jgi:hypothetical protein